MELNPSANASEKPKKNKRTKKNTLPAERPVESTPTPAQSFGATLDQILASDIPVEKWRLAMDMRRELITEQQREAYFRARAALLVELPQVVKTRPLPLGQGKGSYKFAAWEDLDDAIREPLARFGFFFTFRIEGNMLFASLNHCDGHSETSYREVASDKGPGRNDYQAWGSGISYTKRYLAEGLLNIVRRGEDDDATSATGSAKITPQQVKMIEQSLDEIPNLSRDKFLSTMLSDVTSVLDIPARDFTRLMNALTTRKKRGKRDDTLMEQVRRSRDENI